MPRYNCIVWIDKKVDGDQIPLTRFTMMMESYLDVVNDVSNGLRKNTVGTN